MIIYKVSLMLSHERGFTGSITKIEAKETSKSYTWPHRRVAKDMIGIPDRVVDSVSLISYTIYVIYKEDIASAFAAMRHLIAQTVERRFASLRSMMGSVDQWNGIMTDSNLKLLLDQAQLRFEDKKPTWDKPLIF